MRGSCVAAGAGLRPAKQAGRVTRPRGQILRGMPETVANRAGGPAVRNDALDALRGSAILAMALSGLVPRGAWPSWMYHAQLPPPAHIFDPTRAGLTWVDLVFPFFLFAMGAAIPLALQQRLQAGAGAWRLAALALRRGALLLGFAVYVQHINPWLLSANPGPDTWGRALAGFALLFPIFARLPHRWPAAGRAATRVAGLAAATLLCATLTYPDGSRFDPLRSDIIIVVLASAVVTATPIWLVTRDRPAWRVIVLVALVAFRITHEPIGWVHDLWNLSFVPDAMRVYLMRFAQPYYWQYLHIVLPGTIAGDLLASRAGSPAGAGGGTRPGPLAVAGLLGLLLNIVVVAGLQARWVEATALTALALGVGGLLVLARQARGDRFELRLFGWATAWLLIGLALEPCEGGIKKDPSTLSYYYVTAGLAAMALLALMLALRLVGRRPLAMLTESGQNPMIAYVGIRNLVPPVLGLLALVPPTGWVFGRIRDVSERALGATTTGLVRAILLTILVGLSTMVFTRLKVVWRT